MLATRHRRLLLEILRPPPGYRLDRAVGTSFSLDLMALLSTPLAFTFFDWERDDGGVTADPVALLQALRRHASRIHLFCQAGRIRVPRPDQRLLAYLETSVIETEARHPEGLFHPKAWVLRYAAEDRAPRYRVLCLSRNLTFDRSWDTALVLDGRVREEPEGAGANEGLVRFLGALPELTLRPLPENAHRAIERMTGELPRVAFELPEGFDSLAFHPLGVDGGTAWPFPEGGGRMGIVSPFLSEGLLRRLRRRGPLDVLVSLPDSLASVAPEVLEGTETLVLTEGADLDSRAADEALEEGRGGESGAADTAGDDPEEELFSGLHAKLFVLDEGSRARVWTGSANATGPAFGRNVELLVELGGRRSECGIEAFLGEPDAKDSFRSLLQSYRPEEQEPADEEERRRERALEEARRAVARAGFRFRVESRTAEPGEQEETLRLVLACTGDLAGALPLDARVTAWPSTLHEDAALPVPAVEGESVRFGPLSMEALTAFCAFQVTLEEPEADNGETSRRFLLNLPLDGAPEERDRRLLRSLLTDRRDVLRLLLLLLAEEGFDVQGLVGESEGGTYDFFRRRVGLDGEGLLEALLQSLVDGPERLDEVARVVEELAATEEGRDLLPEEFEAVWEPIWAVRREEAE